jgi:cytoskeleton protein RodZ
MNQKVADSSPIEGGDSRPRQLDLPEDLLRFDRPADLLRRHGNGSANENGAGEPLGLVLDSGKAKNRPATDDGSPDLPKNLLRYGGLRQQSIAHLLRERREAMGLSLATVAEHLRLRIGHLQAIEEGRLGDLPGLAYGAGFVRAYATYVGLDPDEVVQRFRAEMGGKAVSATDLSFPTMATEKRFPGAAVLILSLMLGGTLYGAWYYLSRGDDQETQTVAEVPAEFRDGTESGTLTAELDQGVAGQDVAGQDMAGQDVAGQDGATNGAGSPWVSGGPVDGDAAGASTATAGAATGEAAPRLVAVTAAGYALLVPDPKPAPAMVIAAAETAPTIMLAAAPVAADPTAAAAATGDGPAGEPVGRVVVIARQESWVEVKAADGTPVFSKLLRAGERYGVPDQAGLMLTIGNAGGVDVALDGAVVPALGPVGVVRRDIPLSPELLPKLTASQ